MNTWRSSRGKQLWFFLLLWKLKRPRRLRLRSLSLQRPSRPGAAKANECSSMTAYYQPSLTEEYDEDSPGGDFDFFSNLVTQWEAAARLPEESTRQVVVRSGVVLGRGGGAISHMLLPFRLGLGGPIGSGHQFFPWIHIGDLAGILNHAVEANHVQGVLNGVAPASTTTNAEFAQALGAALGRPAFIPVPSTVVQAVFGRERAIMLLEGQKVVPRRTLATGYQYSFPELGAALKDVVA